MDFGWTFGLLAGPFIGAYLVARHPLRQPSGFPRGLATAGLAWTLLTVGGQLLGATGHLDRAGGVGLSILAVGIGLIARWIDPSPMDREVISTQPVERYRFDAGTVAIGLVLWLCLDPFANSLMLPVKVVSDGPIYHLYFAARWWRDGGLTLVPTPFGESAAPYFPANGDLLFTWLFVGWGGDRLAKVGQVPFLLLGAVATFAMARRLGAGGSAARIAAGFYLAMVPVYLFAMEGNVDAIYGAGYALSAYYAVRKALRDPGRGHATLSGLAAGLALGTKGTGIVFLPPLIVFAMACNWAGEPTRKKRGASSAAWLLGLVATSGFWYVRNLLLTGNPIYPAHLAIGGWTILPGGYPRSAMAASNYHMPGHLAGLFADMLLSTLDYRLAPLWIAGLFAWRVGAKRRVENGMIWGLAALAVANVGLYWVAIPYRTQQRFMLHGLLIATVPLARTLDRARLLRWVAVGLLAIHLFAPSGWPLASAPRVASWLHGPEIGGYLPDPAGSLLRIDPRSLPNLGRDLILAIGSLAVAALWQKAAGSRARLAVASLASLLLAAFPAVWIAWSLPRGVPDFPMFPNYLPAWHALERATPRAGARVAYAGTDIPYYLMGSDLRNDVRAINVDEHRGWLLHDYQRTAITRDEPALWSTPRPGWGRLSPDRAAWLANLEAAGIDYLVVARADPNQGPFNIADSDGFPIERAWAESDPVHFQPVHGIAPPDPFMKIFRVNRTDRVRTRHQ